MRCIWRLGWLVGNVNEQITVVRSEAIATDKSDYNHDWCLPLSPNNKMSDRVYLDALQIGEISPDFNECCNSK